MSRLRLTFGFVLVILVSHFTVAQPKSFALTITFDSKGGDSPRVKGNVTSTDAQVTELTGWKFVNQQDQIALNSFAFKPEDEFEKGVSLKGTSTPGGRVIADTNLGRFSIPIGQIQVGETRTYLDGVAQVEKLPNIVKLTDDFRDDDFPSIAVANDTTAWAVWQSYSGQMDEVRISKFDGTWSTFTRVPGTSGDVWRPQVALDKEERPWVVWAQQVDGNFDIYARALDEKNNLWLKPIRLSSHPNPDIDHHLISDSAGKLWVVWQGFHGTTSDIFLRYLDGPDWSEEIRITDDPANDWEPKIATGPSGKSYIVWDTYRNGNYDVYLRTYQDGELGPEVAIATTPRFEAHATVTVDNQERVWVAWDESGANWAKDTGATLNPRWRGQGRGEEHWEGAPGIRIYESRNLNLAILDGNQKKVPAQPIQDAVSERGDAHDFPLLLIDRQSNQIALIYHSRGRGRTANRVFWETTVTFYDGDSWRSVIAMPNSWGRNSTRPAAAFGPDGTLWTVWPTDERSFENVHIPIVGNVYTARLSSNPSDQAPVLKDAVQGEPITVSPAHPTEEADVASIREYRTFVNGTEKQIARGDFHRHTDLSWDGGGRVDGSVLDFYRYMLDAAAMDFGAVTDHNAGGDYEYWWWLTEKTCDLFHIPRTFTTFYGYERSARFPNGHRNIFHTKRGVPVVSFFTESDFKAPRPGVAAGDLMENDTKLLYESLHETGGLAISHTSGSNRMGTDWRDNDPEVEPVVEIFQGARVSYEHRGAPRAATSADDNPPGGYQEAGFLWNAYRKGYRLGTITSSDHNSTHISYAMVFTKDPTREAIFEAIRKRHTYGATDNIVLDYRMGDHFMGEEFESKDALPIKIHTVGTSVIAKVEIIKDEKVIYSTSPNQKSATLTFVDQDIRTGVSYYYVRVIQDDSQIAWSSPIWVDYHD